VSFFTQAQRPRCEKVPKKERETFPPDQRAACNRPTLGFTEKRVRERPALPISSVWTIAGAQFPM
jgi:hypothetical protein